MKHFNFKLLTSGAIGTTMVALCAAGYMRGQIPSFTKQDGHVAPNRAVITYPDGHKRTVMVLSFSSSDAYSCPFKDSETGSDLRFWTDTIREIKDTTAADALIIFKTGTERRARYIYDGFAVNVPNEEGTIESVPISKISKLEFLKPPRKDSQGRAMFDHWSFSPYTGEKLPEVGPAS